MKKEEHEELKRMVMAAAGISTPTKKNLYLLTEHIKVITGLQLSLVTVYRFFGIQESKFGPSVFTLHVLSLYYEQMCQEFFPVRR